MQMAFQYISAADYCRKALGVLTRAANEAVAPPLPLSDKETKAFARELHTVNVGMAAKQTNSPTN